jgi:hypothetical protein
MGVKCRKSSSPSSLLLSCSRRLLLRFRGLLLLVLALDFVLVKSTSYTSGDAIKQSYACDPKGDTAISALPFCDRSLTDEERVEDLISRLTVREKITQLVNTAANVSRLGIPAYEWWGEGLHGVAISPSVNFGGEVPAATSFPQPILTAGSFNTALWNSIGQARILYLLPSCFLFIRIISLQHLFVFSNSSCYHLLHFLLCRLLRCSILLHLLANLRGNPTVLSMQPDNLKLDEEKSKHAGLAWQIGLGPAFLTCQRRL